MLRPAATHLCQALQRNVPKRWLGEQPQQHLQGGRARKVRLGDREESQGDREESQGTCRSIWLAWSAMLLSLQVGAAPLHGAATTSQKLVKSHTSVTLLSKM